MNSKKRIAVINTTHWDREWYFTQEHAKTLFLFHFKDVLENLANGNLKTYLLDGQVSILDEYLSVYPEDKQLVTKFVNENRLTIGPWWSQSDQIIVKGGSLINNARLGIKFAKSLGAKEFLGYIPDSFGQIADMPKILNHFNIKDYIFWRGNSPKKSNERNFIWKSNDGSTLRAHNLKEAYGDGELLLRGSKEQVLDLMNKASRFTSVDPIISAGGDQRALDLDFEKRLIEINKEIPEFELYSSTYQEFFKNVFATETTYEGEMVDGLDSKIHRSIYSSRSDIKKLSSTVESLVLNELIPMIYIAKQNFEIDFVEAIESQIRRLAASQAHDSMGNCNVDATNDDIINRLTSIKNGSEALISILRRKISESIDLKESITIFNTHSQIWSEPITLEVNTKSNNLRLVYDGKELPFELVSTIKRNTGTIKRNESELDPLNDFYEHKVIVTGLNLKPYSYVTVTVEESKSNVKIENFTSKFEVSVDSKKGIQIKNALSKPITLTLSSISDDGDSYDFSPLKNDNVIEFEYKLITKSETNLYYKYNFQSNYTRQYSLIDSNKVNHSVFINLTINKFNGEIDTNVTTTNVSFDHRLTLKVTHDLETKNNIADQGLSSIERVNFQEEMLTWKKDNWKEEPSNIYGVLSWIKQSNAKDELTILFNGSKEYIPTDNAVELTIYRSYQWLGKPLLERRPGIASGQEFRWTETSGAGLLGKTISQDFRLVFGKLSIKDTKLRARIFETKPSYHQHQTLNKLTDIMRFFTLQKLSKKLPSEYSVFKSIELADTVSLDNIIYHAKDEMIITLINNSNSKIDKKTKIIFNNNACGVYETDFLGNKISKINDSGILDISDFAPNEIKNYLIKG